MKNISVIGSGTMGNGIAQVCAAADCKVSLIDISQQALEKALLTIAKNLDRMIAKEKITVQDKEKTLNNITVFSKMETGVSEADLVIEAVSENVELKLNLFTQLDNITPATTILASNTSSISITKIASATKRPEHVIGMHFMNPVPVMKLVEIISGYSTSNETTAATVDLCKKLDKIPVEVSDYPGFVANRILMPMINEAIITLHEGVAGVAEIDSIMKLGMSHPMGPLQLADFIGLDVCLSILNVLYEGLGNPKYAPCPLLVNMVAAGNLGVKSGAGFYTYAAGSKELVVSAKFNR